MARRILCGRLLTAGAQARGLEPDESLAPNPGNMIWFPEPTTGRKRKKRNKKEKIPRGLQFTVQPTGGDLFCYGARAQSTRGSPQKKRATVPGPVWEPIVVPMGLMTHLPFSLGKRASTAAATAWASSRQADWHR